MSKNKLTIGTIHQPKFVSSPEPIVRVTAWTPSHIFLIDEENQIFLSAPQGWMGRDQITIRNILEEALNLIKEKSKRNYENL